MNMYILFVDDHDSCHVTLDETQCVLCRTVRYNILLLSQIPNWEVWFYGSCLRGSANKFKQSEITMEVGGRVGPGLTRNCFF